ncbi:CaiB/BaiF CoA-transferase family protein [Pigmentiphaga sp. D-2]|uniref:CaiB/BaiF CoA transferase family protein n=1 Tax=Pigmentiphaga sp. D-2 TaxID=1002116 RepID=UPI001051CDDA|nr:CaiB/BaiF CoA-transferase family protein [Pigmentiphaga sp. D-2]
MSNARLTGHPGPLSGYKAIEICSTVAGPACGRILADFGADVIKIEPPSGDPLRNMGKHVGDVSLYAATALRNKRAIVIDLKQDEGRDLVRRLAARTDVLVENYRPGVMERLGLGYEELSRENPGLVMVRISGYGQTGPYRLRPGYGAICEAMAGVRHLTGDPDRPPARVAVATTDYLSAVYAAFGTVSALLERARTGKGQVVDVALYETAFTQMEVYVPAFKTLNLIPTRVGPNLPNMAPNSLYPTRDGGYVLIAANSNPTFERLIAVMGRPELIEDPRMSSIRARGANIPYCNSVVSEWTLQHDGSEIERLLLEAEVPVSRVYTMADIFEDPQFAARDMLPEVPHPELGTLHHPGIVPKLSETPGRIMHTGPDLGQDTRQVLAEELQLSPSEIDALVERGIVACGEPGKPA